MTGNSNPNHTSTLQTFIGIVCCKHLVKERIFQSLKVAEVTKFLLSAMKQSEKSRFLEVETLL